MLLTGENGAGKTNILEAISLLTPGKGLRGAELSELRRREAPVQEGWAVTAELETAEEDRVRLGTGVMPAREGENARRQVRIDGNPGTQADLGRCAAAVWLTPQMDRLFIEGPASRRRFLDRLVYALDPTHAARVNAYDRALRERARLLENPAARPDPAWLASLEKRMAGEGTAIAAARLFMIDHLERTVMAGDEHHFFARPRIFATGALEEELLAGKKALDVEERFVRHLADQRHAPRPDRGPHKSDLGVIHAQTGAAAGLCSTGEQKALLISVVLAHARLIFVQKGFVPLLLLDEVAAHIDERRRAALFDFLQALGGQFFLTGTEASLFSALENRAQHLHVSAGRIGLLKEAA